MTKLTHSFSLSLVAAGLLASATANAESFAIINATVHTSTEQGILTGASIVFDEGKITAINPAKVEADNIVDAKGQIITAGFIGGLS